MPGPPYVFGVSEESIRYGDFPRSGGEVVFREYHEVKLGSDTFGAGVLGPTLREESSLRSALEDLLSRLDAPPSEASLVVPDSWLRVAFSEDTGLPRSASEREEVLRWKLKRLVPFKVEELRLSALEVEAPAASAESRVLLLAFGAESLLSSLEASFSSYGIRLGRISNVSLSLLEAVWQTGGRGGTQAVVSVEEGHYTIVFASEGRPILYRHKPVAAAMDGGTLGRLVRRELRLTRTFVKRQLGPSFEAAQVFLFAEPDDEARWRTWLEEELPRAEVRTGSEFVPSGGRPSHVDATHVAPLMGAACTMVA